MKVLHIDIETSPNTGHIWGLFKQNISINQLMESSYTLCWAAKWHGHKRIDFSSIYHSEPRDVVAGAWHLLNEADAVCHYNGTKFDIPTLNKEFLLHGFPPPDPYKQIDLLKVARRQFKFPSNKLDYVAQALGLGGKVKHEGHELWVKCMNNDPVAWKKMERYNKADVRLLEKVYNKLLPWIKDHPNYALYADTDRPVCTNCGSSKVVKKGMEHTKTQSYQRYRCSKCHTPLRSRFTEIPASKRENILTQAG